MTRLKKTDGERIAEKLWARVYVHLRHVGYPMSWEGDLARDIDHLLRKRMAEAWDKGNDWGAVWADPKGNPYRGRRRK